MAGTAGIQDVLVILADITGDATGGDDYTMTRPGRVTDATVICTAANAQGTITVGKAAAAITDAIICAVDTVVTRAGNINDANWSLIVGDLLRFTANGAGDRGTVVVQFIPPIADSSALV